MVSVIVVNIMTDGVQCMAELPHETSFASKKQTKLFFKDDQTKGSKSRRERGMGEGMEINS